MNKYKKLAFNTVVFAIGNFGSKLLVILLTSLYTKYISPDEMSTKDLLESTALFLWPIFSFSMTESIIRYGLDKKYDKRQVFTSGTVLTTMGLVLMFLIVPVIRFIPFLYDFMNGYTVLLLIYTCMSSLRQNCSQFVRARDMVKLFSLDGILATLTLFIFNLVFIAGFRMGVKGWMISTILSDTLSTIFLFMTAKLHKFFNIKYYSKVLASKMMKFALPLIPTVVMWTITGLSDRFFIRNMKSDIVLLGAGAAGLYGVANRIPNLISMVSTIFFQAWNMSAISENDSQDRSDFYEKVFSAYESLLFIASAGLILVVKPVSRIIANPTVYPEYSTVYLYTPILVAAVLFTCLDQFLGSIYTATKHTKNSFWTSLVACAANIILNISLIPVWGIQGASLATFFSYYICFWIRIIDARYYVPFKFNWVRSLVNTAILFVMCWVLIKQVDLWVLWLFLLTCAVCFINYKALLVTVKKLLKRG